MIENGSDLCYGRFVGGRKLIEYARSMGADLMLPGFPPYRELLMLEHSGDLVPIFRYCEPASIRVSRGNERHPEFKDSALVEEGDTPRISALSEMMKGAARWGHHPMLKEPRLHPLDDPPEAAKELLQDPVSVQVREETYDPIVVGRLPNGNALKDYEACVPVYRHWQALHLVEISLGGHKILHGPGGVTKRFNPREVEALIADRQARVWQRAFETAGFHEHHAALEAVSWYVAYAQAALNGASWDANGERRDRIEGNDLAKLRAEEQTIALEAMQRYGVSREDIFRLVGWAAERASEHRDEDRRRTAAAYVEKVAEAIALLRADTVDFQDVRTSLGPQGELLDDLFPDWLQEQVGKVMDTMRSRILPDLARIIGSEMPAPSEAHARDFLEWLASKGLYQTYCHIETLVAATSSRDQVSDAKVATEVQGMSSAVEHIVNELGGAGEGLAWKLPAVWAASNAGVSTVLDGHFRSIGSKCKSEAQTRFGKQLRDLAPEQQLALERGIARRELTGAGIGQIVRDAAETRAIRNAAQHHGLRFLPREDLIECFIVLLRTAFLLWYSKHP